MYNTYNPYMYQQPQMNRINQAEPINQPMQQQYIPQPTVIKPLGLLGKSVDSIEVVKAMDIALDGSVNYFPLTDGSAIVTKQILQNGTSKTVVYKPIEDENDKPKETYVTIEEFNKRFDEINFEEIDELLDEFKDIKKDIKDLKTKLKSKGD